jgi:hypothetical protein
MASVTTTVGLVAPQTATIAPSSTFSGTTQTFTVTVTGPPNVSFPLTYTWDATGQSPAVHGSLYRMWDTQNFMWQVIGTRVITVGVENLGGIYTATQTITLNP